MLAAHEYLTTQTQTNMSMAAQFDIFKSDLTGSVMWVGIATDLESAKARVEALGKSQPGEYLILDQHTGDKLPLAVGTVLNAPTIVR